MTTAVRMHESDVPERRPRRRVAAWLRLSGLSAAGSMSYRPYFGEIGGVPIVDLVVRAMRRMLGDIECVLDYRLPAERARLQQAADLGGMHLIRLDPVTPLRQHMAIVRETGCDDLCVLQPPAALAPVTLLHWLYAHHVEGDHACTRASQVPAAASPLIFTRAALEALAASQAQASAVDATGGSPRDTVDLVVAAYTHPDAAAWHAPEELPLRTREDWRTFGSALQSREASEEAPDSAGFDAWLAARHIITPRRRSMPAARRPSARRVLYVSTSAAFAGGEHMLVKASRELAKAIDLHCLLVAPGPTAELAAASVPVIAEGVSFGEPTLASFLYCDEVLKRVRPHVVHCNGIVDWPMIAACLAHDLPIVQHVRVPHLRGHEDQLGRATCIVSVSQFVARVLARLPIDQRRVRVLHDGIDTAQFRRAGFDQAALRDEFGLPREAFVVLCVARYSAEKRVDVVLDAFCAFHAGAPEAVLCLVGEPDDPSYVEMIWDRIDARGLRGSVRHFDGLTDIRRIEATADALVSASELDSLPNCILEAMAMEIPIAAVRSGGVPEMIDARTAALVEPGEWAALAGALQIMHRRDPVVARRVAAARRVVEDRFSIGAHARGLLDLYAAAADEDWAGAAASTHAAGQDPAPATSL